MTHEIPITLLNIEDDGHHLLIKGKINGKTALLLIDTGASKTVFDEERIKKFTGNKTFEDFDHLTTGLGTNNMKSQKVIIDKFQLGGLILNDYLGVIINMFHVNESYKRIKLKPIDGVLGGDILFQYKAVIDYKKSILKLYTR